MDGSMYWTHNSELPLTLFATPNHSTNDIEEDTVHIQVRLKEKPDVFCEIIRVNEDLTVEKYLEIVRNFIEKNLVWAYDSEGELIKHR